MLRGWISYCRAPAKLPLVAGAIAGGLVLSFHNAHAGPLDEAAWQSEIVSHALAVEGSLFDPVVRPAPDGRVHITSIIGDFEGEWSMHGHTVCFYFDEGPRAGETCVEVVQVADGLFKTSEGDVLRRVAAGS